MLHFNDQYLRSSMTHINRRASSFGSDFTTLMLVGHFETLSLQFRSSGTYCDGFVENICYITPDRLSKPAWDNNAHRVFSSAVYLIFRIVFKAFGVWCFLV